MKLACRQRTLPTMVLFSLLWKFILPEDEIVPMFNQLKRDAATESLQWFCRTCQQYVDNYLHPSWCVCVQPFCADEQRCWRLAQCNGRHAQGRSNLSLYGRMVQLLHEEAKLASLQIRLVSEKLQQHQRKAYRELQSKVFHLWDSYRTEAKTANQLLRACAYLYGPVEE